MLGDNAIGAQDHRQAVQGCLEPGATAVLDNAAGSDSDYANFASEVAGVWMAPRSPLLKLPDEIIKKISAYCSDRDLRNFGLVNRLIASITAPELKFRQKVKESKKIVDSYIDFAGLSGLSIEEIIKMVEALTKKCVAVEIKRNHKKSYIALADAFKDMAGRIALAGPPSEAHRRIYSKAIQGVTPGHRAEIMLPSLLVTSAHDHAHLFELKNSMADESVIEAAPCAKYGSNGQHIHAGKCLTVSANAKVLVLHRPEADEVKILAAGSEKSFTSSAVENFKNGEIFHGATGECDISPDGKSLLFLFKRGMNKILVRGYSDTPDDANSFKLEPINLAEYGGQASYGYEIYHVTQPADHTWSLVSAYGYPNHYQLFFLPLPLRSAPAKISEKKYPYMIMKTSILPDNTIAAVSSGKIEIFGADGSVRAACKVSYYGAYYDYGKIQAAPDGRTLAILLGGAPNSGFTIAFYQIPAAAPTTNLLGAASTSAAADPPELVHLWSVPWNGAAKDYDFMFIDYGSKLALTKRAEPSERIILELTHRTASI